VAGSRIFLWKAHLVCLGEATVLGGCLLMFAFLLVGGLELVRWSDPSAGVSRCHTISHPEYTHILIWCEIHCCEGFAQ
jgi:hypothetical protein